MSIRHFNRGFTLIELMIVVLIISIIATVAYPNYISSMQKTRRSDAIASLNEVARLQEEFFVRNRSYAETLVKLGYGSNTIDSQQTEYDLSMTVTPSGCAAGTTICTGYVVTAVPNTNTSQKIGQQKDDTCQSFSLDNLGHQTSKNKSNSDSSAKCW